jgi:hypothetical protein
MKIRFASRRKGCDQMAGEKVGGLRIAHMIGLIAALACLLSLSMAGLGCGSKPAQPPPEEEEIPVERPNLFVENSWSLDNQTHQEPMQVPNVTASAPDTLFVAFIASDSGQGPQRGGPPLDGWIQSVEGGGLQWTRRATAHLSITGEPSIAEIWTAFTSTALQSFTVTVTRNNDNGALTYCDNYQGGSVPDIANGMVFIQAITGADQDNPIGATAVSGVGKRSGQNTAASVTLVTTRSDSLVAAVGADWSQPKPRTVPADQVLLHEDVSTPNGDSYWVQGLAVPAATPGQVRLYVIDPSGDDCNMAAIEILRTP